MRTCIAVLALIATACHAQEVGHIQVQCPAGIQIFLDGDLKGIASADVEKCPPPLSNLCRRRRPRRRCRCKPRPPWPSEQTLPRPQTVKLFFEFGSGGAVSVFNSFQR